MTVYDLLVLVYFLGLLGLMLTSMARNSYWWKPLLVVLVLSLCGLMLWYPGRYGPSIRLKPGLDLAGGTTLVYDVKVPEDANAQQVIDDLINVLRDRVDPTGTRNLVWRQVAGNRIEISMALATAETGQRRHEYLDARDRLLAQNISTQDLDAILRAEPQARQQALDRIAANNPSLRQQLADLAAAHDRLTAAAEPYQAAQSQHRQAQAELRQLPADATDEQRQELQQRVDQLLQDLLAKTRAYNEARKAFDQLQRQALASNIAPQDLERVLNLSTTPRPGESVSPRQQALDQLKQAHPLRAQAIDEVAQAYAAYERVKGPLDDPNDLIALLRGSGVLEFRIAAIPEDIARARGITPNLSAAQTQQYRQQLNEQGPRAGADQPWRWFPIDSADQFADNPQQRAELERDAAAYFAYYHGLVGQEYGGDYYLLLANTPQLSMTRQESWELTSASPISDMQGRPAVAFSLDARGGRLMGALTEPNVGKPMAILLDNRAISAPVLQSQISDSGQISGRFSQQELNYLLRTLKAGSTEAELGDYPISIKTTGPQFGQDNLHAGLQAVVWSFIAVALFMAVYYFIAGLVADFALLATILIILGVMAMINATFTLPGIAGVVLTIGMAVDANVLIYDRIREELERKADAATALRLGFGRAFATILDANITTLITCIVLGYTATAEVKGFAVTLGIGILATLFAALFCSRVLLDLYVRYARPKSLTMLPTLVPLVRRVLSPSINWIGMRYAFFGLSGALILASVVMVYERGQSMFDIEFRSGTQVSFDLAQDQTLSIRQVRDRLTAYAQVGQQMLEDDFDPARLSPEQQRIYNDLEPILADARHRQAQAQAEDQTLDPLDFGHLQSANVVTLGQAQNGQASGFTITTLMTDAPTVSSVVKAAFADVLTTTRPVSFAAEQVDFAAGPPVYPIRNRELGQNINRPGLTTDVSEYLGGVAIVLEDMSPAPTLDDLKQRITRMRQQPAYENLGYRPFDVIGLELADASEQGEQRYRSAVIVSRDSTTNYAANPEAFTEPGGLADTEWALVKDALHRDTSLASVSNFSPAVSNTMKQQAIAAMALSLLAVGAYIWFRFGSVRYSLAAVAALAHDVIITLGLVALSGLIPADNPVAHALNIELFRIDLAMIAALLTIVGYSINDTIIVFDRIRENRGRLARATPGIINDAINQTISRTVITSGTTLISALILYAIGGSGIRGFAFAMLVGVTVGTYSSIALASPILLIGRSKEVQAKEEPSKGKASASPAAGG
ncbi:MAG TPA: protein translocase subunit SecD [Phycisphaeraceae bacterium]